MKQIGIQQALGAYRAAGAQGVRTTGETGDDAPAPAFQTLLKGEMTKNVEALRHSEQAALEALVGQANVQALVEAVSAAELSLQKVTAIRDRVLSAYQEIIRMPI